MPELIRLAEDVMWDVPEGPIKDKAIHLFQALCSFADSTPAGCPACRDTVEAEMEREDDPRCVCGVYRAEHALFSCGDWEYAS